MGINFIRYVRKVLWWSIGLVCLYGAYYGINYAYETGKATSHLMEYENTDIGIKVVATKLKGISIINNSAKQRIIKIKYGNLEKGCNHCDINSKHSLTLIVDAKSTYNQPMNSLGKIYKVELCSKHMVSNREITLCEDLLKDEEMD